MDIVLQYTYFVFIYISVHKKCTVRLHPWVKVNRNVLRKFENYNFPSVILQLDIGYTNNLKQNDQFKVP